MAPSNAEDSGQMHILQDATPSDQAAEPRSSRQLAELSALDEITQQINSSMELDTVLTQVASAAKRLLGGIRSFVCLLDRESGEMVLKAWDGVYPGEALGDEDAAAMTRVSLRESFMNLAIEEDRPLFWPDVLAEHAGDPRVAAIASRFGDNIRGTMVAPVRASSEVVGALGLQVRRSRHFNDQDLLLVRRLANQAGIAIQNARLLEAEREKVAELREQRQRLAQSIAIHDRLTARALAGSGLGSLADTLATLVGNPVVVMNRFGQPIASAQGGESVLPDVELQGGLKRLASESVAKGSLDGAANEGRPVYRVSELSDGIPSHVIARVNVQNEVFGYVAIFEQKHTLEDFDFIAIEHAATIIALEMLREKTAFEVETRLSGDFVEALLSLDYANEGAMIDRAAYLGHNLRQPHRIAVVALDGLDGLEGIDSREAYDDRRATALKERTFDVVNSAARELAPRSLAVPKGDAIVVLVNVAECVLGVKGLLEQVRERVAKLLPDVTVSGGIGRECRQVADFRQSYEEARRGLAILQRAGRRNEIAWFEQLEVMSLLSRNSDDELAEFVDRVLGRVVAYDRQHGSQLVASLDAYVQSGFNLRACARTLHLHKNSLAYRLRRLQDIGGLNLEEQGVRLRAELALHILSWLAAGGIKSGRSARSLIEAVARGGEGISVKQPDAWR